MKLLLSGFAAALTLLAATGARADSIVYAPAFAPAYAYVPTYTYAPGTVAIERAPAYAYVAPAPIVRERRVIITAPQRTVVRRAYRTVDVDAYAYAPDAVTTTYTAPGCIIDAFGFERCH
jgi:hypothetical protein